MTRQAKAASAKPIKCQAGRLGRVSHGGLVTLLVTAAVLLLVPTAQAFAAEMPHVKVNIGGAGSGEVVSEAVPDFGLEAGTPPIACSYNGTSTSGVCENVPGLVAEEAGFYGQQLHATPASGSEVVDWTVEKGSPGECPSAGGEIEHQHQNCQIYAENGEGIEWEVTATFALDPALSINQTGAGTGTIQCEFEGVPGSCAKPHPKGTKVKLSANLVSGTELAPIIAGGSAEGACSNESSTKGSCEFKLEESSAVGIKFIAPGLNVYLGGTAEGSVTSTSPNTAINCGATCSALYENGIVVALEAHPNSSAVFAGWIGCKHTGATTCETTIEGESEVTAVFVKNGVVGPTGPTGPTGTQGPKGTTGATGATGANGAAGAQGPAGQAGANGAAGAQGPAGPQGPAGANGKVTCKVKGKKVTCTVKYAKASSTQSLHWRLMRGGHAISHGTSKGALRLDLSNLRAGNYVLHAGGESTEITISPSGRLNEGGAR